MIYRKIFKRPIDLFLSFFAILFLLPVFLIIAIIVKINLGSPIIFKQKRPGLNNKIFTMYKFRSMKNQSDIDGVLLSDEQRVTKFGKALRASSLDELPELFNILKGDMSVVGPRPQLIKDLWFMNDIQRCRHSVRPGLTGLAQICGRNEISWEEKFYYDLLYIEKITLLKDVKIIFSTIFKVFKREDINTSGLATAEDYGDYLLRTKQIDADYYTEVLKSNNGFNK